MARAVDAQAKVSGRNVIEVYKTMQGEGRLGKVSWWHLIAYVLVLMGFELCIMTPLVAVGKINAGDLAAIVAAMTSVTVVVAGLLGDVAQDTTSQKLRPRLVKSPMGHRGDCERTWWKTQMNDADDSSNRRGGS